MSGSKQPEPEAEVLETPEIDETVEQEAPETDDQQEQSEQVERPDEGEEETVIGFADEEAEEESEADTPTIKRLRERNREQTKLLRDREKRIAELETSTSAAQDAIDPGPEPTIEDCEWDGELLKVKTREWDAKVAAAKAQKDKAQEVMRRVQQSYDRDMETYTNRKATLGVPDYEDAEAVVVAALSLEQQAVALQAANDPAAMVYALSKSPSKLAELAKIDNPWKLAAAIARLEGQVKVTKTRRTPPPDKAQRGSASMQATDPDKELARLEKEAERTGNRTAVIAYKRQMNA